MPSRTFRARVAAGEQALFIEVPFDVKEAFGRARPPVVVRLGAYEYRSTVAVYGGKSLIGIRKSHRDAAGVRAGDTIDVTLTLDDAPRTVEPPPELAAAFKKNARARAAWDKLSYTHQREHAEAILQAKKPETRARRVEKALAMLTAPR